MKSAILEIALKIQTAFKLPPLVLCMLTIVLIINLINTCHVSVSGYRSESRILSEVNQKLSKFCRLTVLQTSVTEGELQS